MSSKILLIDCDPRRSDRIAQPLARAGHEILRAVGGREGLRTFLKKRPSLVLIEAMLEREHGTEVCKKIRRTPAGRDVPIIVHSDSLAGDELAHMLENSGCSVFLEMPCAGEQLLDVCEQLMPRNGGNGRKRTPLEDEELEEALDEFDSLLADQEGGAVDVDDQDLAAVDQAFEELTRPGGGVKADEAEIDSKIEEQLGEAEPTESGDAELVHEVDDRLDALAAATDESTAGDDDEDIEDDIDAGLEALSDDLDPEDEIEDEQTEEEIDSRVDSLIASTDDELDMPIEGDDDELEEKLETQLGAKAAKAVKTTKDRDEPAPVDKPMIDAKVDAALAGKPDTKPGGKQTDDEHPDLIGIDDRSIDWKKGASGKPQRPRAEETPAIVVQPVAEESATDESLEELSEKFPGLVSQPKRPARWWLVGSMLVLAGVAALLAVLAPHLSSMLMSDINRLPAERVDEKIEPLPAADPADRTEGETTDPATEGVARAEPAAGELVAATTPPAATERDDAPASKPAGDTRPASKPAPPPSPPAREATREPEPTPNREPLSTRNTQNVPAETTPRATVPEPRASEPEPAVTTAASGATLRQATPPPSTPRPQPSSTTPVKEPESAADETPATEVAQATPPPPYQEPSRTAPAARPDYESETLPENDRQLVAEEHGPSGDAATPDAFRPPVALSRIAPSYSRKQLKGQEHAVVLKVLVSERGKVVRVVVKEGTRDSSLVASAIDAVLRYKYQPATENGDAVRAWTVEKLTFSP